MPGRNPEVTQAFILGEVEVEGGHGEHGRETSSTGELGSLQSTKAGQGLVEKTGIPDKEKGGGTTHTGRIALTWARG